MFLLGLFAFLAAVTATSADDMQVLNCNTLTEDLRWKMIRFARAMEVGDTLTITGTVYASANMSYVNLYPGFNNTFMKAPVSLHVREQYIRNLVIYNSWLNGRWGKEEFTPLPYKRNTPYTISIKKNQRTWSVYQGSKLIKTYAIRHPLDWKIGNVISYGDWSVDSISMLCVRAAEPTSPAPTVKAAVVTAAPTTTKQPTGPIAEDPGSWKGDDVITKNQTNNSNTIKNSTNSGVSEDIVDTGSSGSGNLGNTGSGDGSGNGNGNGNNSGTGGSGGSGGSGGNGGGGQGGKGGLGGHGGGAGGNGGNGGNGANGSWGQWGQNGTGWNGQYPYPPYPYPYPYPPGYYPPGGFNGQNGNGQPNIIIINQKSDDDDKRRRKGTVGGRDPSFSIDDSEDDDEECECED